MHSDEFVRHQSHHLFLLIGANPLPNYVAAQLLVPDNGRVYLLASKGTSVVADRLIAVLRRARPSLRVDPYQIHDTDEALILRDVKPLAEQAFATHQTVGLNYTGGTKPMALHVARGLMEYGDPTLSYLDPRQLDLVVEPRGAEQPEHIHVGDAVEIALKELVELHGYALDEVRQTPKDKLLTLAHTLHELFETPKGHKAWRDYCMTLGRSDQPEAEAQESIQASKVALPEGDRLSKVRRVLVGMTDKEEPTLDEVALALGEKHKDGSPFHYKSYAGIFWGGWLEEFTLEQLSIATRNIGITEYGISLKPYKLMRLSTNKDYKLEMELDLAALHGYQLFAISCQVTDSRKKAKEHFLEVVVRAQQLGGEEARFGLVCFLDAEDAEILRNEVQEEWGAQDRIRVFGRREQMNLAGALEQWIRDASHLKPK